MGNIVTYQVKILFANRDDQSKWLNSYNVFETLCLLRNNEYTHSYEVPFYIDDSRFEFQFGEKWSLFEGIANTEYREKVKNRIWEADNENLIQKIYYRSSDGLDKIFSVTNKVETSERYCRYGFDKIKFKLREGVHPKDYEIKSLNISDDEINLNGSYLTENGRVRILGIKTIYQEEYFKADNYYKTLTGLCRANGEQPYQIYPFELQDAFKLFFRECIELHFYWKGRRTLRMINDLLSNYPDSFLVESDDYWDNVVDHEFYADTNENENVWNTKELDQRDKYSR